MNDDKNFLVRWSRRKHATTTNRSEQSSPENAADGVTVGASAVNLESGECRFAFDHVSLPTVESIGAGSDIRAFLESGVPVDLARAALRRAWSLDPAIRDFIGLSENSWDFNAPGAMHGFGSIDKEEAGRLLTQLLGEPDATAVAEHPPLMSLTTDDDSQEPADDSDLAEQEEEVDLETDALALIQKPHQC